MIISACTSFDIFNIEGREFIPAFRSVKYYHILCICIYTFHNGGSAKENIKGSLIELLQNFLLNVLGKFPVMNSEAFFQYFDQTPLVYRMIDIIFFLDMCNKFFKPLRIRVKYITF